MRSRDTRTMADTIRSYSARNGGKFARFRCAGAPRNRGIGWGRTDEQSAASMGYSDRISECREVFELNCCAIPLTAVGSGGIFAVPARAVAGQDFGDAGRRRRRAPHRSCTSFRFLRGGIHRDCCRPRDPAGNCLRSSRRIHRILVRRTACTYSVVGPNCCMGREMQRSRGKLCAVSSRLRGRRTRRLQSSTSEGTECKKGSETFGAKRDRGPSSEASVPSRIPGNRARSHARNLLAGWPPSKSVGLLPFRHRAVRALRCWGFLLLRESQAAQRYTRLALCLEPVQASVASVSLSSQLARSHQKAMCLPANLSTLPKYLQSWVQFWTGPEARTDWRKSSEWIRVWQQRKRSTPRISTAADQEGEGSSDWAAMPRCSAFYAPVTNALELSLRRTRRGVREDLMTLPGESWSWQRHAKEHLLHHCGHFRTLRRVIVMVAGALDEGRIGGFERQHATLCQICGILESAAKDSGHDLAWRWPLLGLSDSDARPDVHWSPAEDSEVIAGQRKRPRSRQQRNY